MGRKYDFSRSSPLLFSGIFFFSSSFASFSSLSTSYSLSLPFLHLHLPLPSPPPTPNLFKYSNLKTFSSLLSWIFSSPSMLDMKSLDICSSYLLTNVIRVLFLGNDRTRGWKFTFPAKKRGRSNVKYYSEIIISLLSHWGSEFSFVLWDFVEWVDYLHRLGICFYTFQRQCPRSLIPKGFDWPFRVFVSVCCQGQVINHIPRKIPSMHN